MENKYILIIGGFKLMHKIVKSLGAKIILITDIENLENLDQSIYELVVGINKFASQEEWLALASSLNKLYEFQHIANFQDMWQYETALIAEKLSLKFHTPESVESCQNKYTLRKKLKENYSDSTPSSIVKNKNDIENFGNKYGYPLILKPVNGWGSQGVSKINSPYEINEAMEWFYKDARMGNDILIESFIEGNEYSIETFSEGGKHKVMCVTKKFTDNLHFVEIGHCLPYRNISLIEISNFITKILNTLKILDGPTHCEIKVTDDKIKIIEINNRLAGYYIPELIKISSGIDILRLWALQSMGNEIINEVPSTSDFKFYSSIFYKFPDKLGIINDVIGIQNAKNAKNIVSIGTLFKPYQKYTGIIDSFNRYLYAIAKSKSFDDSINDAKKALNYIHFNMK
ncbi:ATP-grasp domain-containing protein [Mammaliicoccus sp. I-M36]|uniref:ATP-grasp domain-containing protein n=1 Tax=Mammaliicoccus sp. I-M36 TaxID=2898695 RepID=UPI001EFACDCB|nr:ATP-grasp domain-containing protein [Mammaliicoccus sp. I-M36]